jgi:hypothetical protein
MSKSKGSHYIEVQKGPIHMDEQFNGAFRRQPEMTMEDIRNNELRQGFRTLTKHEPKR